MDSLMEQFALSLKFLIPQKSKRCNLVMGLSVVAEFFNTRMLKKMCLYAIPKSFGLGIII